jgi:D-erythro-7,8-dihydroneopterin triphosphate epimerase
MIIRVKNLRLRTVVGIHDWERHVKQDVIINVEMTLDGRKAAQTDAMEDTVDYKRVTKKIIQAVENSEFYLLDTLAHHILKLAMEDELVERAMVEVDKPHALRFADSVSITCSMERSP